MMCARFLKEQGHARHGRAYRAAEAFFDGLLRLYDHGLEMGPGGTRR